MIEITGEPMTQDEKINLFYLEKADYENKHGIFAATNLWVKNKLLEAGSVHIWYQQHVLNFTRVFGRLGCRITGKICGIGGAERNWGALSDVVTKNRNRLSTDKSEMLTAIYSRASIGSEAFVSFADAPSLEDWSARDFDYDLGLDKFDIQLHPPVEVPKRVFLNYLEDWEIVEPVKPQRKFTGAVFDNTQANQFRLLEKYKNIRFVDEGEVYVISDTNLVYKRGTGFSVVTNTLDPDEDAVDLVFLSYCINENLHAMISEAPDQDEGVELQASAAEE